MKFWWIAKQWYEAKVGTNIIRVLFYFWKFTLDHLDNIIKIKWIGGDRKMQALRFWNLGACFFVTKIHKESNYDSAFLFK